MCTCKTAALYSSVLGKPVAFTQVPPEAAKQSMMGSGWPEWQVDGVLELMALVNEGDPSGLIPEADDNTLEVLGRPAESPEAFMGNFKGMFGPDNYAWKDAGFQGKTAVIMGYGGGVADVVLQGLTEAGCKVAIVSRTQSKLDAAAAKYNATLGAGTVQGFSFDMSNTAGVKDLLASIGAAMGPIKVIYYNAVKLTLPHDATVRSFVRFVLFCFV